MPGTLAAGSTIQVNISGTYTTIAGVTSIGGLKLKAGDVDVTTLLSPSQWKEFIAGFKDGGVVNMEVLFIAATMTTLMAHFAASPIDTWRINFSNGSKFDFSGYINELDASFPLEEAIETPFAIKVSGVPTFTA